MRQASSTSAVQAASHDSAASNVATYFDARSAYWSDVYGEGSLDGAVYRDRMGVSLRWIAGLALPAGARVLDVGCGAGLASVALAARGYRVVAVDIAPGMLELTRRRAADHGVASRVTTRRADVAQLADDGGFDLVLGLGLLPWVKDPAATVAALGRLVRPGGHLLVTADNRWSLFHALDPGRNPRTRRAAWFAHRAVERLISWRGQRGAAAATPPSYRHAPPDVDGWLAAAGLTKVRSVSVGFGPLTFFDRKVMSREATVRVHERLQALADRQVPGLRDAGAHYVVLARSDRPAASGSAAQVG
ncbi:MAG TPA: methyltransferase domain-containing protein [Polyangia bacterium]